MGLSFPLEFFPLETLELLENLGKLELKLGLEPFTARVVDSM